MLKFILTAFVLCASCCMANAGDKGVFSYRTAGVDDRVHSLQVESGRGFLYPPVINLGEEDFVVISFDLFGDDQQDLSYRIIHCNANWTPSQLSTLEYMDGFDIQPLDDWAYSFNTHRSYVNYRLQLPNDDVSFKVSGNYVVEVFPQNRMDDPVLYACFSVSEEAVKVSCEANSRTDMGYSGEFQQVSFRIARERYDIVNPAGDLKIYVMQNNRLDNMAFVSRPQYFNNNEIVYEHDRNLIFEAGNEYRRFEMVDTRYKGMHVDRLAYFDPYYHAILETDPVRRDMSYSYDETQHGKYFIREADFEEESSTQADYFVVHFTLDTRGMLLPEGDIYIDGELAENRFGEHNKMLLNPATNMYEKIMMLKQGSYNYQYLFVPKGEHKGRSGVIEGNKYQTRNEYRVNVYHRRQGERYDRLIGMGRCLTSN